MIVETLPWLQPASEVLVSSDTGKRGWQQYVRNLIDNGQHLHLCNARTGRTIHQWNTQCPPPFGICHDLQPGLAHPTSLKPNEPIAFVCNAHKGTYGICKLAAHCVRLASVDRCYTDRCGVLGKHDGGGGFDVNPCNPFTYVKFNHVSLSCFSREARPSSS